MAKAGWKSMFLSNSPSSGTPHMMANSWALSLWAAKATNVSLFSRRVYDATAEQMARWPNWACTEYMSEELAHEVLVLAWLVRVNDSATARGWLDTVASTLIAHQRQDVGAIKEWVNASCGMRFPPSNDAYGRGEGGLMQSNADPAADLLYTQNFALMSLHEASHAVGLGSAAGKRYAAAVDKLADFFVRVQVQSKQQKNLDGSWVRGLNVKDPCCAVNSLTNLCC